MKKSRLICILISGVALAVVASAHAQEAHLQDLIQEALKNNPEILASQARIEAAKYRIPQVQSLPDPTITAGYQNVGLNRYSYGDYPESQWMFTASQMFPFPGKRGLKGEMAERDAQSLQASHRSLELKTASRLSEIYYDLFLVHKNIDLIRSRADLFAKIEDIAASRYATGKSSQQEVLMAQTEKYILLEKEEMLKQKVLSYEAMMASTLGRGTEAPIGRPVLTDPVPFTAELDALLKKVGDHSPEIKARERMIESAETRLKMAGREYYPDVTLNAGVAPRGNDFQEVWGLTATINIPLYFRTKQDPAVKEANAGLIQARHDLNATRLMIQAAVRDNYSMIRSAEKLMELYKNGLIPKTYQDFESAVSGYGTGRTEAIVAITRLKTLIDYENLYWGQYVEREKAIARLHSIAPPAAGSF